MENTPLRTARHDLKNRLMTVFGLSLQLAKRADAVLAHDSLSPDDLRYLRDLLHQLRQEIELSIPEAAREIDEKV